MSETSTRELILLHLNNYEKTDRSVYPYEVSTTGITDVLEIKDEDMSERMKLISTLSDMKQEGMIDEKVGSVEGFDDERNVYFLTEDGKEYAESLHHRITDREITVLEGDKEYKAKLSEIIEDVPDSSLVRILAKTRNGVLEVGETELEDWFIDREEDLNALHNELTKVKRSGRRTVLISGETGVGKTALISRFETVANEKGFEVLKGKCPKGISEPYHSFRKAFEGHLKDKKPELFDQEEPIVDNEDEIESQKRSLFVQVAEFVNELSRRKPLVVFIDDLQWIDRESVELYEFLVENISGEVLFIGSYRPEEVPEGTDFRENLEEITQGEFLHIQLENFGVEETREVIKWFVETPAVPSEFVELVHEKTGGNPLFIRESIKQMLEKNVVQPKENVYPSKDYEMPVPDEIEKTIERRLRSLDISALKIVEMSAVVNDEIKFGLLNELVEIEEASLRDYLDVLQDAKILSEIQNESFEFMNTVTREAVLKNLSEEEKKALHRKVAEEIENSSREKEWEEYEKIGYHYDEAGELEKALEYYLEAGGRAKGTYALEKALDNYERGFEISRVLDEEERRLSIAAEIGHVHYIGGEYDEADRYFRYVWNHSKDDEKLTRAARYRASIKVSRGEYDEGIGIADRGLSLWDGEPSEDVCGLLSSKGWALQKKGDLEGAVEIYERELSIAEELDDEKSIARALQDLGIVHKNRDESEEAKEMLKEVIEKLEDLENRRMLARSIHNLGIVYWKNAEFEKAKENLERSLELKKEVGDEGGVPSTLISLGAVSSGMGDIEEALDYYDRGLEKAKTMDNKPLVATTLANEAGIYLRKGELDKVEERYERSLEINRELGAKYSETFDLSGIANLFYVRDELDQGLEKIQKALEISEEHEFEDRINNALSWISRIEAERGNLERAAEVGERAVEKFDGGEKRTRVDSRCALVDTYLKMGRVDDAYVLAQEAVEIADSMSDIRRKIRSKRILGECYREKGEFEKAKEELNSCLAKSRKIGSKLDECETILSLGSLEQKRGNEDEARDYFESGIEISEECGFGVLRKKFEGEMKYASSD